MQPFHVYITAIIMFCSRIIAQRKPNLTAEPEPEVLLKRTVAGMNLSECYFIPDCDR